MGAPQSYGERLRPGRRPDANIEILGIVADPGGSSAEVIYKIRWLCCGRPGEMPHKRVVERERKARSARAHGSSRPVARCMQCHAVYRRSKRRDPGEVRWKSAPVPDYGVSLPTWPRPPSIAGGYWRWEGPR